MASQGPSTQQGTFPMEGSGPSSSRRALAASRAFSTQADFRFSGACRRCASDLPDTCSIPAPPAPARALDRREAQVFPENFCNAAKRCFLFSPQPTGRPGDAGGHRRLPLSLSFQIQKPKETTITAANMTVAILVQWPWQTLRPCDPATAPIDHFALLQRQECERNHDLDCGDQGKGELLWVCRAALSAHRSAFRALEIFLASKHYKIHNLLIDGNLAAEGPIQVS